MRHDYCIIGGGIVGLAAAQALVARKPGASVVVLEKEARLAVHQTGHNSGVIHSGVYYQPGSLMADFCRRGAALTQRFCDDHAVPYEMCGKLVVAQAAELGLLRLLAARAAENGIPATLLDGAAMARREPHIRGAAALHVPGAAIVDYAAVAEAFAAVARAGGAEIVLGAQVVLIAETAAEVIVGTRTKTWRARRLGVCAGLQADRMVRLSGLAANFRIVPFRGEYYRLHPARRDLIRHLIYPVPDPALPFLGIHLTRTLDGGITAGPNAALSFAREKYGRRAFDWRDSIDSARYGGFWRYLRAHAKPVAAEARSALSKRHYLRQCQVYCPDLEMDDLVASTAGIRAQAILPDGRAARDFLFVETKRMLHVCNAPSPAATSAIPIGEMIAKKLSS